MNLQPILEGDLIIIRPLNENDFDELFKVAKDPLIWELHPNEERCTVGGFRTFFDESLQSQGALVVIDKLTMTIIGSSRFKKLINCQDSIEIGWSFLAREYWGGLYNRATKLLLINYAFKACENIIFFVDKYNFRSQKAVLKLGARRQLLEANVVDNSGNFTYAISKKDWK